MSERRRTRRTAATARHYTVPWLLVAALVLSALGGLYVVLTGGGAFAQISAAGGDTEVLAAGDDAVDEDITDDVDFALAAVTHDIYLSRDPFDPVVPEPATSTSDQGSTSDDTSGGDTSDDTSDDTNGGDTSGVCRGTSEVVCEGRVVSLLGITRVDGEQHAVIQVDVNIYEVAPGQIFAEAFQLRSIDDPCVSLLYGDEAFSLCTGDRLLK